MTDNGDGTYDYSLAGRSKTQPDSQFEIIIDGLADPRPGEHKGNGDFLIDFDAGRRVNPIDAARCERPSRRATTTSRRATSTSTHGDRRRRQSGRRATTRTTRPDGSGDMVFGIEGDMGNGPALEQAVVRSRWLRAATVARTSRPTAVTPARVSRTSSAGTGNSVRELEECDRRRPERRERLFLADCLGNEEEYARTPRRTYPRNKLLTVSADCVDLSSGPG